MIHGKLNDQWLIQKSDQYNQAAQEAPKQKLSQHQKKKLRKIKKQMLLNGKLQNSESVGEINTKKSTLTLDISEINWQQLSKSR